MPPLILVVAGILGGAVLVRLAAREKQRISRELEEARQARLDDPNEISTLRHDPNTGTYRPE